MRDAAVDAAYELGLFDALASGAALNELAEAIGVRGRRRLRALLDVLVAFGVLAREDERFVVAERPARPVVARAGWGLLADVIRNDRPLPPERGEAELRYHQHLLRAGAAAARELAPRLGPRIGTRVGMHATLDIGQATADPHLAASLSDIGQHADATAPFSLLDLGGGAGAYAAAFLDAHSGARATLVDSHDVIELAKPELARFPSRVRFVAGDARTAAIGDGYNVVLLANVLHLHGEATCRELCAVAARAVAPGGLVVIKDLGVDEDRRGPLEGLLFALNMAIYTVEGDVYEAPRVCRWLAAAGLVEIEQTTLTATPDGLLITARRR
jgi:SAM-dependent methyltransferase